MSKVFTRERIQDILWYVFAFLIALFISFFIIMNCRIPSESMESTLNVSDRLIANRLAYLGNAAPERYDIVVFKYPDNPEETYIKRVIGLPGETVTIRDGHVYINDSTEPLDESFLNEKQEVEETMVFEVPEGCYFMMGDNRNLSFDSRYWDNPFVPESDIYAKAVLRYWPLNQISLID